MSSIVIELWDGKHRASTRVLLDGTAENPESGLQVEQLEEDGRSYEGFWLQPAVLAEDVKFGRLHELLRELKELMEYTQKNVP